MFHIPSTVRRPLAVVGAAVVGLAAAVALGSPASAHHPAVSGTATCVEGKWQVDWKVTNSEHDLAGDLTGATFSPAMASDTVKAGATLPAYENRDAVLRASQVLDAGVTEATLSVDAHWNRDGKDINATRSATVTVPERGCTSSKPGVTFTDDCAGQVTAVVSNGAEATKALRYHVLVDGSAEPVATGTVQIGTSSEPIVVPPAADGKKVTVVVRSGRTTIGEHEWKAPAGGCVPESRVERTCDELRISLTNPPNGLEFDVVFTPNTGQPQTMKVEKGRTSTVTFPASDGLVVTPSIGGKPLKETVSWTKPANCAVDTPTLPRTGANAGAIAGGAGGLLVAGGALFLVARRRRLRFTA